MSLNNSGWKVLGRRPRLVAAGAIALVAVVGLVLFINHRQTTPPEKPLTLLTDLPVAQPINLTHFVWKTASAEFLFYRSDVNGTWNPPTAKRYLSQRERLFEGLSQFSKVQAQAPRILLRGQFRGGIVGTQPAPDQWVELGWDGQYIFLTGGTKAGFGRLLSAQENALFMEGKYAFENHQLDWCKGRLVVVKYEGKVLAEYHDNVWKTRKLAAKDPLQQSEIEKWMGQNCQINADAIFEDSYQAPKDFQTREYEFLFKDRSIQSVQVVGPDTVILLGRTVVAPQFVSELDRLAGR